MKKMMLLAVMVALAAMMLAAAPASAQTGPFRPIDGALIKPGSCGGFPGEIVFRQDVIDAFGEEDLEAVLPGNNPFFCVIFDDELPPPEDGGRDRDRDRDGDRDRDRDNVADVVPVVEINQETEQECESGDVNQSFDVSQTGDNSNQTVGLQGTANTGCAQNVTDIVDVGPLVGDFAGDNVFVDDDGDRFINDFNDGRLICFEENGDGDSNRNGIEDELECRVVDDGFIDDGFIDDGFVCFDENGNRTEDERECVFVNDFLGDDVFIDDDVFINDADDFNVRNVGDGTEFEIRDSGASIDMSPTNTTNSHQEVNQAAAASAPHWVWTASGWMWM
jgi:hypothetical protein